MNSEHIDRIKAEGRAVVAARKRMELEQAEALQRIKASAHV